MTQQESDSLRECVLGLVARDANVVKADVSLEPFSFSGLLETFVHLDFTEDEAILHWKRILENVGVLGDKLGRKVSIHLAMVDYFTGVDHMMDSPMLVELRVFRQTERLAMIDGLTGIFNRRYMDIILKKEFNRCDRYGKSLSVCIIDIDNFKNVNDTKGHLFGDIVLREIAELIKDSMREEDIVCRYGGEEFLAILPETNAIGAHTLAERIRAALKKDTFFVEHGITFSAGTATYPVSAVDMVGLVQAADKALYQAKFAGKDRVVSAAPERRKFGRYRHSWGLDIYPENETRPIRGVTTQNVSLGGIQFDCPTKYPVDACLNLIFTNLEPEATGQSRVKALARITWIKRHTGGYSYGVSFLDPPETLEAKLKVPDTVGSLA